MGHVRSANHSIDDSGGRPIGLAARPLGPYLRFFTKCAVGYSASPASHLWSRMDEIADRVARDRTNAARERTSTHEAQRLSN
jgi:hypothetical protein